jgi:flagellar hook assembly protein FlgD
LPRATEVTLRVYNLLGEEVITLLRGKMTAGMHTLRWDGRDAGGLAVGSGVYLLKVEAGAQTAVRKMVITR